MTSHRLVALISLVAVVLVESGCARPATPPCNASRLCLFDVTSRVTNDHHITLNTHVASVTGTRVNGKVWWVLAPIGPGTPFDRAVYQSRIETEAYAPGTNVSLNWDAVVDLPGAFYDLALFAHVVNSDGSETVADESHLGPVYVSGPRVQPWLIRRSEGSGPLVVTSASGPQAGTRGLNPFARTLLIENQGTESRDFSVWLEARAPLTGWEDRWFTEKALYSTTPVSGSVAGHRTFTARVDGSPPVKLLTSFPTANFWLVVKAGGSISDEVLMGGSETFSVRASTNFARLDFPSGPVGISAIDDHTPWKHSGLHVVTLTIVNFSGSTQPVQAWWYLGALDDMQPWAHATVGGFSGQFKLGPWESRAVAIRASRSASPCQCKLSAWTRYQAAGSQFLPADDLWLSQPVTVS